MKSLMVINEYLQLQYEVALLTSFVHIIINFKKHVTLGLVLVAYYITLTNFVADSIPMLEVLNQCCTRMKQYLTCICTHKNFKPTSHSFCHVRIYFPGIRDLKISCDFVMPSPVV